MMEFIGEGRPWKILSERGQTIGFSSDWSWEFLTAKRIFSWLVPGVVKPSNIGITTRRNCVITTYIDLAPFETPSELGVVLSTPKLEDFFFPLVDSFNGVETTT